MNIISGKKAETEELQEETPSCRTGRDFPGNCGEPSWLGISQ